MFNILFSRVFIVGLVGENCVNIDICEIVICIEERLVVDFGFMFFWFFEVCFDYGCYFWI